MTHNAIRQAKLLLLLVLAFTHEGRAADNLAVVIDVSGSMKNYGAWQADARDAVSAILAGRPLPPHWSLDPNAPDLSSFASGPRGSVTLLRFGSVQQAAEYPFFTGLQKPESPAEFAAGFPLDPSNYREMRTNKALAESVAIRSVVDDGGKAEVIMISDFYSDASLSDRQIAFINDTEDKFTKYTVATLSWASNPRVQIKLLRFMRLDVPPTGSVLGTLRLFPPHFDENSNSVRFTWSFQGQVQPERYDLRVTDAQHSKTLFVRSGLGGSSATYPKAVAGQVQWMITAYMPDGKTVEQRAMFLVPGGGGMFAAVLILILIAGAGIAAAVIFIKKHGPPSFLSGKRSPDTEI